MNISLKQMENDDAFYDLCIQPRRMEPLSTRQQKTDSQEAEIQRWLKGHGLNPKSVQWFEDRESERIIQRPAFDDLQQKIFQD